MISERLINGNASLRSNANFFLLSKASNDTMVFLEAHKFLINKFLMMTTVTEYNRRTTDG
ncbi:hypothetical protein C7B82_06285 [Stenomitos frigidus ULC18]|uniref:Uncharacterized protein n=1 Tax=Stenomitos frigidus ULC18 TaxID=2107698 RepID=A0A2T1EGK4_9CYAN|nr:hypothetical protein C7B82_06285 [Stenomitos frigidus ULC18]